MLERIAILGTGLIGTSIALALKRSNPQVRITGFDHDPGELGVARSRGAIDAVVEEGALAGREADLVVVAVPPDRFSEVAGAAAPGCSPTTVVTDVASAKTEIVARGEDLFGSRFVGGHPMAGSERRGAGAADPDLFQDASWILTPTDLTSSQAYRSVSGLASSLGARVVALDPAKHDSLVAGLSHVPQLVAGALVQAAASAENGDPFLGLAGGGFRDTTRIASSDPTLWVAILQANRAAVLESLARFGGAVDHIARLITEERWSEVAGWLEAARDVRGGLFLKPELPGGSVALSMMIPDRPGVLAEVTTEAGRLGANIEDLRIVHSTEGGRGRLELIIAGSEAADALSAALESRGYHVAHPGIDFST